MASIRILPVLALVVLGRTVTADEITLTDGQVVDGDIVSPAGAPVVDVRIRAGGMEAVRHIPRDQIVSIRVGASAAQRKGAELQARRDKLGNAGTAEEWWVLAQEAKKSGDQLQFRACVNEVLQRDRNHEPARRIIGHVLHRGVWMRPEEQAVAMGQVRFRDQWVSWQDKERILALEAKAKAEAIAALEERRRIATVNAETASHPVAPVIQPVYRVMYWPGSFMSGGYYHNDCSGLSIGAAGGGNNHRWVFRWNF